jgi:hypothetical protein
MSNPATGTAAESLDASSIPQLIRALLSPLLRHQHGGAFGMRKVLSREKSPPIDDVIAAGAVPLLAKLLENDDTPVTQFEAASELALIPGRLGDSGMPVNLHRNMTWTISNVCRCKPAPPLSAVASVLPYLAPMI